VGWSLLRAVDGSWLRHGAVSRVSRTGAEVEPGLSRPEQKRRRVTWGKRYASVEVPVVLQQTQTAQISLFQHPYGVQLR
jgi:hypothetical protein